MNSLGPQSSGINSYSGASGVWDAIGKDSVLRTRAELLGGLSANTLNIIPINKTIGSNLNQGIITYAIDFDNRPTNCIPGALAELINVSDTAPGYLFASIPTIGRKRGPILQWLGAADGPYTRTLSIEIVVPPSGYPDCSAATIKKALVDDKPSNREAPDDMEDAIDKIIDGADPTGETGVVNKKVFYSAPEETWDYKSGRYTLSLRWTYEKSLSNYPSIFSPNLNF